MLDWRMRVIYYLNIFCPQNSRLRTSSVLCLILMLTNIIILEYLNVLSWLNLIIYFRIISGYCLHWSNITMISFMPIYYSLSLLLVGNNVLMDCLRIVHVLGRNLSINSFCIWTYLSLKVRVCVDIIMFNMSLSRNVFDNLMLHWVLNMKRIYSNMSVCYFSMLPNNIKFFILNTTGYRDSTNHNRRKVPYFPFLLFAHLIITNLFILLYF